MGCPCSGAQGLDENPERCLRVSKADRDYVNELSRKLGKSQFETTEIIIDTFRHADLSTWSGKAAMQKFPAGKAATPEA